MCHELDRLVADYFRLVNTAVEPLVRAGLGSPGPWPTGLIVMETRGRRSGRPVSVPLVATRVGDLVLVSTVRSRSQWLQNAAAEPRVRYWMNGRAHDATAHVVANGLGGEGLDSAVGAWLARTLSPWTRAFGMAFAILSPVPAAA